MELIVFEDDATVGFGPLTTLRHMGQLNRGTKTLLEAVRESIADSTDLVLWGRDHLRDVCRESLGRGYNERADGLTTFVNARARPGKLLLDMTSRKTPFVAVAESQVVAARVRMTDMTPGPISRRDSVRIGKSVEKLEAPADSLFTGYWDLVQSNGLAIAEQARRFEDPLSLPSAVEVRGPRSSLRLSGRAEVELHVTFDTRLGPVVVEEGASVESFSRVMGPCYLGPKTKLYSATIGGGTSVFDGCKVGGQVENSIIMAHSNKAHHGYVGDSYVGEWVNLGAGSTFSNLKNTYGNVRLDVGRRRIDSGMLQLGPVIGDMSKVSIGTLVYAGRLLGTGCQVGGLASKNVPSFTYSNGSGRMVELLLESVLETQRRMMERRGKTLTRAGEALIRKAFRDTSGERRKAGVRKGRLS
ncbi:MAG: putative sugar nucleotidyl transferase [Nitrososphaerales archaeon]